MFSFILFDLFIILETLFKGKNGFRVGSFLHYLKSTYKGDPSPCILRLCNGIVSHWAQIGGPQVFADYTCKKQMQNKCKIRSSCGVLHAFIFTLRLHVTYTPDEPWLFFLLWE